VIALSGSGGKTSLMMTLANWYREQEISLILTTTTRTEALPDIPVIEPGNPGAESRESDQPLFFLRSGVDSQGKWLGLTSEAVDRLGDDHPDRVILVEVDGAGKKALKYYRDGEPVWPARTSLALVVMGLGALGEAAGDAVFRFGRVDFRPQEQLSPETFLTWDHYYSLLADEGGYLDHVPPEVPVVLVLAGMGDLADSIGLFEFMGRAMAHPRIPLALFCETSGQEPSMRAVCRGNEESSSLPGNTGEENRETDGA